MKKPVWILSTLLVLMPALSNASDSMADKAVDYRQGVFSILGWNIGPMVQMMKKEKPYDKDIFARNAQRMAAVAPMALEGFIPDSATKDSDAKPKIWSNMDDFKSKMKDLETASAELAAVAKTGDMAQIGPKFQNLGQACKACHDEYREE
ncbi:MAG: cytochrome c [Gammaproteobacteria bacterium]|nr:cytochrome c [Gammaproteobacteria bacterium]